MLRFNTELLIRDFDIVRRRRKLSTYKVAARLDIAQNAFNRMRAGVAKEITVTSLVRMMDFMGETDIAKYIYDDGE